LVPCESFAAWVALDICFAIVMAASSTRAGGQWAQQGPTLDNPCFTANL